jgi:SAM-dependent methyltransferase
VSAPSPWVVRFARRIRENGTVLDLAAGSGRHARYLRTLGFRISAVDVDVSGMNDLRGNDEIELVEADLESNSWPFPNRRFDGIVVTNYLHRPLFPVLAASLAPGGVLIYETFAEGHEKHGRPRNPDFLLREGELLDAFSNLCVVGYEHGFEEHPRPAVRQRICATRPGDPEGAT